MNWWQALTVALLTLVVSTGLNLLVSRFNEKKEFNKFRREKHANEIESLKNKMGILLELAANWKPFEEKKRPYLTEFENDYKLVGTFNKYPSIAEAARDTVQWCRIVASCEMKLTDDLIENKKELGKQFSNFLTTCDDYMNSMV